MQQFLRLWPYLRPRQRFMVQAALAALLASTLWGAIMLLSAPICKVLLEQKSLSAYVAEELAAARADTNKYSLRLATLNEQQTNWPQEGRTRDPQFAKLQRDRSRCQTLLGEAHRREWWASLWQNRALPWLPEDRFDCLASLFAILLAITALHGIAVYLQELWMGCVVQGAMRLLRARLFHRTLRLDAQTLGVEGTPAIMARFSNDLNGLWDGLNLLGGKILLEPLKAGVCLTSAFAVNWRLTLFSLLCAPIAAVLFSQFGRKLKKASRRQMETVARVYAVLQETLESFRLVTAFGNQRRHRRQLYRENREYFHKAMQINRIDALVNPTVEMLGIAAACLAVLPAAYLVMLHKTTVLGIQLSAEPMELSQLAVLYTLLGGIIDPARKLSSCFSKLKKSLAACERVFAWMDREALTDESDDSGTTLRHQKSIEFDRVSFRYQSADDGPNRDPALDDLSLRVEFGEVITIVGGNGSGKSTLVGLLPRFYDPRTGAVRIDGMEVREIGLRALRDQIGWVPQEPMLFDGTIAENIAWGRQGALRSEIEEVARRAHVWEFAADWPQGLDTTIGEKGSRLSGGQRQRIALARAMLRDPAILVLDEATSAIDAQSESLIHQTLQDFTRGRTTLVITHAMTSKLLEITTRIVVLDRGRLIATGRHEQLLATCPDYATLFAAQQARRAA